MRADWYWPEAETHLREVGDVPPNCFTRALAENLPIEAGSTRLIDVGCGNGIIGIYALIKGAAAVAFNELLPGRLAVARANLAWHCAKGCIGADQVAFYEGSYADLPSHVLVTYDVLAFNPPLYPEALVGGQRLAAFLSQQETHMFRGNNPDGLAPLRTFVGWYAALKPPKPRALINVSRFLGRRRIESALAPVAWEILGTRPVPLRDEFHAAASCFAADERRDRGLWTEEADQWTEEILTISLRDKMP
jgi:methylase of polypeptide subunit release factors